MAAITSAELLALQDARPKTLSNQIANVLDTIAWLKMVQEDADAVQDGNIVLATDKANEAKSMVSALQLQVDGLINDDALGLASTWSSSKIDGLRQNLQDQINLLSGGTDLSAVMAAISSIQSALATDEGLLAALAGAVTTNAAQVLTAEEQDIVIAKIGAVAKSQWDAFFTGFIRDPLAYVLAQVSAFRAGGSVTVANYVVQ